METGVVKWFNVKKGYGFISGSDENDYFVHFSSIVADGFRALKKGQEVEFTIEKDDDGRLSAIDVKAV